MQKWTVRRRRRKNDAEPTGEAAGQTEWQREEEEGRAADTRGERRGRGPNIQERSAVSKGRHRSNADRNRPPDQIQQRHSETH